MKKFEGNKPLKTIRAMCKKRGWHYDQSQYDQGGDWVNFDFVSGGKTFRVIRNCFGRFMVRLDNGDIVTESSSEFDNEKWYGDLLDFLYTPAKEAA